jgi:hypothetical protein
MPEHGERNVGAQKLHASKDGFEIYEVIKKKIAT